MVAVPYQVFVLTHSSLAVGHLALADYYNYLRQDWPHALAEYALARKAAPNNEK